MVFGTRWYNTNPKSLKQVSGIEINCHGSLQPSRWLASLLYQLHLDELEILNKNELFKFSVIHTSSAFISDVGSSSFSSPKKISNYFWNQLQYFIIHPLILCKSTLGGKLEMGWDCFLSIIAASKHGCWDELCCVFPNLAKCNHKCSHFSLFLLFVIIVFNSAKPFFCLVGSQFHL